MPRVVKPEIRFEMEEPRVRKGEKGNSGVEGVPEQDEAERRVVRSQIQALKNLVQDGGEGLSGEDTDGFKKFMGSLDSLQSKVQKPRELVADVEILLGIANKVVTSARVHGNEGVTPSDFVTSLLRDFGQGGGGLNHDNLQNSVAWSDIGKTFGHVFRRVPGCCTMLGPMDTELKQRKASVSRKRVRPTESARPEELDNTAEEKTDTDKNVIAMFNILKKKKNVRLDNLVLNRNSFAQTVENIFALSFLVKDGRVEIKVDENGFHLVSPKNSPRAELIASRDVSYCHFIFRFDFKDWQLMKDMVEVGDELMPHRSKVSVSGGSEGKYAGQGSQATAPSTPIRKLCRNRGLVIQEQPVAEDSPEREDAAGNAIAIRKGKRKLQLMYV